jgi:hypothetical protein
VADLSGEPGGAQAPSAPTLPDGHSEGDTMTPTIKSGKTASRPATSLPPDSDYGYYADETGSGWLFFAATLLGIGGVMRIIDSIWAFRYHGAVPDNLKDGLLGSNLKHYAWLWLVVGIILVLASFGVMARSQLSRWIGFFAAGIAAVSAMAWMPYYPGWSITYVAIAGLVFYALAVHGGRQSA